MKQKIKRLLVPIYLFVMGTYKHFFGVFIPKLLYRSAFLSSVYYLFSGAFKREHKGVLAGKVSYYNEKASFYMLVRNTHRIEKGLTMRPLRPIFAKHYIEETVTAFRFFVHNPLPKIEGQMKWSNDVLSTYFDTVTEDSQIKKLKALFNQAKITSAAKQKEYIPYRRNTSQNTTMSYEDFFSLTRQRRSVRWFLDKQVPRALIDKALQAGLQAPSACNRQPFEYRIFDEATLVEKGIKIPLGTVGFAHNVPVFVVIIGNLNAYFSERDRHLIYVDASLANMGFMLALETLGLSSCPLNWPDIAKQEKQMQQFLKLEKHQRAVMCMAVGYPDPDGKVAYSEKRNLDLIRKYN